MKKPIKKPMVANVVEVKAFDFSALAAKACAPAKSGGSHKIPMPKDFNGLKQGDIPAIIAKNQPSLVDLVGAQECAKTGDFSSFNVRKFITRLSLCGFTLKGETADQLNARFFGGHKVGHSWAGDNMVYHAYTCTRLLLASEKEDDDMAGTPISGSLLAGIVAALPESERPAYKRLVKAYMPKSGNIYLFAPNFNQVEGQEKGGRLPTKD